MKYRFSPKDYENIKSARVKNHDKQIDKRLLVLEMRCEGKTQRQIVEKTG